MSVFFRPNIYLGNNQSFQAKVKVPASRANMLQEIRENRVKKDAMIEAIKKEMNADGTSKSRKDQLQGWLDHLNN